MSKKVIQTVNGGMGKEVKELFSVEETDTPDELIFKIRVKKKYYDMFRHKAQIVKTSEYDLIMGAIRRSALRCKSELK